MIFLVHENMTSFRKAFEITLYFIIYNMYNNKYDNILAGITKTKHHKTNYMKSSDFSIKIA